MAKREKKPDPLPFPKDPGAALFLELMMQMLAFFILLTSYAVIVEEKRLAAIGSLAGTFSTLPTGANLTEGNGPSLPARDIVDGNTPPKRTAKELTDMAKDLGGKDAMQVLPLDQNTVKVRFSDHITFNSGSVELSPDSFSFVEHLADVFKKPEIVEITIEGHTDDTPMRGGAYQSNWELSAARAMTIFHALSQRGIPNGIMIAAGMGDKHPLRDHPELDRRVDITLKFRPVTDKKSEISAPPRQRHRSVISPPSSGFF